MVFLLGFSETVAKGRGTVKWKGSVPFISGRDTLVCVGSGKPAYFNRLAPHDAVQIIAQKDSHKIAAMHKTIVLMHDFRLD